MVGIAESSLCQMNVELCTSITEELRPETVQTHFPKTNGEFKVKPLDMDAESNFFMLMLQLTEVIYLLKVPVTDKRQ